MQFLAIFCQILDWRTPCGIYTSSLNNRESLNSPLLNVSINMPVGQTWGRLSQNEISVNTQLYKTLTMEITCCSVDTGWRNAEDFTLNEA